MKIHLSSFCFVAFSLIAELSIAQNPQIDLSYGNPVLTLSDSSRFAGDINGFEVLADNSIIAVGDFASYNGVDYGGAINICKLSHDGALDMAFGANIGNGFDEEALDIERQSDGKFIVVGKFNTYNNYPKKYIVRLNTDGSVDQSFLAGTTSYLFDDYIADVEVLPNDQLLVGGNFTTFNGASQKYMARLNSDGSIDNTFVMDGTGFSDEVNDITYNPIYDYIAVCGEFYYYNGAQKNQFVVLNSNGSISTDFNVGTGMGSQAYLSIVQSRLESDGHLLVGGYLFGYNGQACSNLIRLDATGSIVQEFPDVNDGAFSMEEFVVQNDGKIVCIDDGILKRFQPDGTLDNTFYPSDANSMSGYALAFENDGKILVGGVNQIAGYVRGGIARMNTNGTMDYAFMKFHGLVSSIASATIHCIQRQSTGKFLLSGWIGTYSDRIHSNLVRTMPDGSLDSTFHFSPPYSPNVYPTPYAVHVSGDDNILVGTGPGGIMKLLPDGQTDAMFYPGSGFDSDVYCIVEQPDNKYLIGGAFEEYSGATKRGIVRLNNDGIMDPTFNINQGFNSNTIIRCITLQSDGKILVGGSFNGFNGATVNTLIRLNPDGTLDNSFNASIISGTAMALAIQPDGKILVGGPFYYTDGTFRKGICRLNEDGSLDETFNVTVGMDYTATTGWETVHDFYIQQDGRIVCFGTFNSYENTPAKCMVRLEENGIIDPSFDAGVSVNSESTYSFIRAAYKFDDSSYLIGGFFHKFHEYFTEGLAKIEVSAGGSGTSNQNSMNSGFTIYPSPNSGLFTLRMDQVNSGSELIIRDVHGREVYRTKLISLITSVNVNLDSGLYLVELNQNGVSSTRKMILN
ncbi:MAG: T9SS type A sorting domain-containing protein [Flavobacteriales bacterium]|nr:T9SS type A sorting domain-containing protein [Flavobacteriales bacterium]